MSKEIKYPDEVVVRDVKLDEPFFLPRDEAEREEKAGRVVIQKDEKQEGAK